MSQSDHRSHDHQGRSGVERRARREAGASFTRSSKKEKQQCVYDKGRRRRKKRNIAETRLQQEASRGSQKECV